VPASKSQILPLSSYLIETVCPETLALRTRLHGFEERDSLCSKCQNIDYEYQNFALQKRKIAKKVFGWALFELPVGTVMCGISN
jgi:hypothetical protein